MTAMGKKISGKVCTTTCGDPMCMEPEHAVAWTRSELQERTGKVLSANLIRKVKLAEASRRRSTVMTMEIAREIRASGLRPARAAERWGIQLQLAARILRNDSWREYSSPFAGLMR